MGQGEGVCVGSAWKVARRACISRTAFVNGHGKTCAEDWSFMRLMVHRKVRWSSMVMLWKLLTRDEHSTDIDVLSQTNYTLIELRITNPCPNLLVEGT
jgi:hypothetical protein